VPCANCPTHIFVAKDDPRLPAGPFFCPYHSDVVTSAKAPDHVTMAVLCDRCDAQLIVEARTREEAREKLRAAIVEQNWRVVDRLEGALDTAAGITGRASSTMICAQDLCSTCAKQL
jgi:hypothetical protein